MGLPEHLHRLLIDPAEPRSLYAGTDKGLFWSPDGGDTWQRLESVPAKPVTGLAMDAGGNALYAAVNRVGVFKGVLRDSTTVGIEVPKEYSLFQNYPNPFNPVTTLTYAVPSSEKVTLKVYDTLGRKVAVLVDGFKMAGRYSVTFDATKLSSGVYFYSLTVGTFSKTRKMLLVK